MTRKKTDFRALKARRAAALERPELRFAKPKADRTMIDAAIAAGRVTKISPRRRR